MSAVFPHASDVDPALRRAALTLHATADQDRERVLAGLPEKARPLLKKLLAELADLGIPRDPAMVHIALRQADPADVAKESSRVAESELHQLNLPALSECLRNEPPALVACALAVLPARVRASLLAEWPLALRHRLPPTVLEDVPPQLQEVLMEQLRALTPAARTRATLVRRAIAWVVRALKGLR